MTMTIKRARERLAEYFNILAENLENGDHSDEWLDVFEEASQLVNQLQDMEDAEEGGDGD